MGSSEHLDVLIVGAGLSSIGAACHLAERRPQDTFAVLEARDAIGGTWDLFRYPGVRSDSDMFTLGYGFRPWTGRKAMADGASIREYVRDTAAERDVERHVRFGHRVVGAEWNSDEARWTVRVERADAGDTVTFTCRILFSCTGYFEYDRGFSPEFPGAASFRGTLVHPQHWPEDLDWTGKRIAVIGSGATAVTLVPALAERAAHVTMVQRSPSWVMSLPAEDAIARLLNAVLPARVAYAWVRGKNAALANLNFKLCRSAPRLMRWLLLRGARRRLPEGYDVARHFTPSYDPWDQRLCFVPNGDLFRAISSGTASVATGHIRMLTEAGIELESGTHVDADIVVTATGLNLLIFGGIQLIVDGVVVNNGQTVAYKGMMLSGVPNFALAVGYTNNSWTLKIDLVCEHLCRLLDHMDAHGCDTFEPSAPDPGGPTTPLIDLDAGYVRRAHHLMPRQGHRAPWKLLQDYPRDVKMFRHGPVAGEGLALRDSRTATDRGTTP